MWGPQGWNQWALQQPAMFNDIPHEQIDWAELAKQWIQMKQTHPPSEMVQPAPPPLPPPLPPQVPAIPVSLPPPPGHSPIPIEEFSEKKVSPPPPLLKTPASASAMPEPFLSERPFPNEPGLKFKKDTYPTSGLVFDKYQTRENFTRPKKSAYLPKASDNNFWGKPHWEENTSNDVDERLWNPPSVDPSVPMLGKETFDYGHVRDNPPLAMQSIDYNHMSEFSYNSVYPPPVPVPESHYDQYWSQINVAPSISPMFLKKERTSNLHVEEDTNQIDAAKRKTLPAWIRDGLEKMEQERLKRLEKEREAKESAEKAAKSAALKKESKEEPSLIPSKSKFESDSEEGELEEEVVQKQSPPVEKRQPSPVEDLRTEEEKKQDLVLKVRRTLTEVLLSVTSSEMIAIAQDMLKKAISKAPARQLAPSTSLSSVASGLRGLASYGTESEASEAEEDEEDEEDDSEEELYRKIKEKKRLFAVKERKIIADLEEKELEEKLSAERLINEIKSNKERTNTETKAEISNNVNLTDRIPANTLSPEKETLTIEMPTKSEDLKENNSKERPPEVPEKKKPKAATKDESVSSDSSSSSSDSESESSDKHKKKISKETKKSKPESKKDSKKDKKSSKKDSHRKRSRSRDSESSGKHRRQRSRERKSKKKKSKRSDSSSSSSDSSHKKGRRSSKYESSRNHKESRNKSHDDRKRKRSPSPSRSHRKSDSHSSRSYKHEEEKHRRHKEEKRQREHRRSSSPSRHRTSSSSKVPRKYRSSRSLSSESESSGKKSKKSRNR